MITQKDKRIVNLAKKMLRLSQHEKYHISAVLVRAGRVISIGVNKVGAHKRFITPHRKNYSHHAEIDAILNISKESIKGSTLVVVGQTAHGSPINARPCYTCIRWIENSEIKRVVYLDKQEIKEL